MDKSKLKDLVEELLKADPNTHAVKALTKDLGLPYCADSAKQMIELLEVMNSSSRKIELEEGPTGL